jgi:choline-sulfatase
MIRPERASWTLAAQTANESFPERRNSILFRKRFLILVLFFVFFSSFTFTENQASEPNIVLITIDTLRADHLGCYGYNQKTSPTIDALAAKGLIFEKAYSAVPLTLPSHTTILTGLYPANHGLRDNAFFAPPKSALIAELLKQHGYATAAFVSAAPLATKFGLNRGFNVYDDYFSGAERPADNTTERALAWLKNAKAPYFLWVHYFDPHAEYNPPPEFKVRFERNPYDGEIAFVDRQIGRLLSAVGKAVILLTADHGESLGEHGESTHGVFLYNSTLHVPLILVAPGNQARRVREAVTLCDITPTIFELTNISVSQPLDGVSLLRKIPERTLFAESLYAMRNFGYSPIFAAIAKDQKYIHVPKPELYDLKSDPSEKLNKAGSASAEKLKSEVKKYARHLSSAGSQNALSAEELEKLRSLGYLGGALPGSAIDPKEKIQVIEKMNEAMTLLKIGKYDEAEIAFQTVTKSEQQNSLAFRFLGDALAAQKKYGPARQAYEKAFHLLPDPEVGVQLAKADSRLNELQEAERVLKEVVQRFPDFHDAYFELASLLASQNKREEALQILDRDSPDFHNQKGIVLLQKGDFDTALAEFQTALSKEENPLFWNNAGLAYQRLRRFPEAEQAYQSAISLDPGYAECQVNLGILLIGQHHYRDALSFLQPAVSEHPELFQARLALGFVLENLNENQKALETYRQLLTQVPPDWAQKEQLEKRIQNLSQANQ